MSECLQGHTERCKAFNQVTGKFLCENPRDEVKLLSQSLTLYKQAAEDMNKTLIQILGCDAFSQTLCKTCYVEAHRTKEAYSKLKEELHV